MKSNLLNRKYLKLVILTTVIGFIINLPLFTKNILTADVLLNTTYYAGYSWELSLGRFGLFIFGFLKSYLVIPHLELFISLILISFISILLIELFDIKNKLLMILTSFILLISPNISATLLFHYCSLPYTIAFFCSVISIYFLFKTESKFKYLMSFLSLVIALSMYQAYIQPALTLFMLMVIKNGLEKNIKIKEIIKYILTIAISLVAYFIAMKLSLILFHIDMSSYSGANQFGITNILNIPKKIIDTYITFYHYFFGNEILNNTYLANHIFNFLILCLTTILLVYRSIKNKLEFKENSILFISFLALPICMNFILLIIPDTSMQLLMSSSYILIFILTIYLVKDLKYSKYGLVILLLLLSRNFIIENYATTKTLEMTYHKTYKIASDIVDYINQYGYKNKVMIYGNLDHNLYYNNQGGHELDTLKKLNYGFIVNSSLFWDEYTNVKNGWTRFLYEYLGFYVNFVTAEEYNKILTSEEFIEMNQYPEQDSIQLIEDIIVIKISNN